MQTVAVSPNRVSVLVVDDDDAIRRLIVRLLTRAGYDVDQCSDGEEALGKLRLRRFDAVVLDLMMRTMSGVEMLNYLDEHEDAGKPNIVVVTAASTRDLRLIVSPLVRRVVRKPFDINEFVEVVEKCMRSDEKS